MSSSIGMDAKIDAVAVYCASSLGAHKAYSSAATSLGYALASKNRPLVYGGGSKGIMGVVSSAALEKGGKVIGVIPHAMVAAGGEGERVHNPTMVYIDEPGREKVESIIVDSMHERKIEMAKRVTGFIGLPGGLGTFEEILEVTTWTQLGIHDKPVVLLNVLRFWEPMRLLIRSGINAGFIRPASERLVVFVDGPEDLDEHEGYDWGTAALRAVDGWERGLSQPLFDWSKRTESNVVSSAVGNLAAV